MPVRKKISLKQKKQISSRLFLKNISKEKVFAFFKRPLVIIGVILAIIVVVAYLLRSMFIVATINGESITRLQLISDLERQYGKQALEGLVIEKLILQEAKSKKITVSDSDVSAELKKIESQVSKSGQTLDQLLTLQGMSRVDLQKRIKIQKMVEKLLINNLSVSEKEVDDYISSNKDSFTNTPITKEIRDSVKEQLKQSKITEKYQQWLSDLKKKAKIEYSSLFSK